MCTSLLNAVRTQTHVTAVQVALACEERGRLMEDVWQGFAGAMRGAVSRLANGHAEERRRYPRCTLPVLRLCHMPCLQAHMLSASTV
jgi:hypothetical protein